MTLLPNGRICRFLYIFSFSVILCNIRAFRRFSKAALKNLLSMTRYNSVSSDVCVVMGGGEMRMTMHVI